MSMVEDVNQEDERSLVTPKWYSWNRFNEKTLKEAEYEIFKDVGIDYKAEFVNLGANIANPDLIYTISLNTNSKKTPLVLLHGLGGGVGIWCCNLKALSKDRPVYAFDLIGFGRSSRPDFSIDGSYVEHQFVKMIERWRETMKLEKFIMCGHSLGGYLSTSYALNYPNRVKHIILAGPWGFTVTPKKIPFHKTRWDFWYDYILAYLNPYAPIRLVGPFGQWLLESARPELLKNFKDSFSKGQLMLPYLYHLNAQYPSGERGFWYMTTVFPWCKYPLINRIDDLDKKIPITHIVGTDTIVDPDLAPLLEEKRKGSYFKSHTMKGATHHVYIDNAEEFNKYVLEACAYTDSISK